MDLNPKGDSVHRHDDLEGLQKLLGVSFRDVRLLDRARTDESAKQWCPECRQDERIAHNRMFEYLGDVVLEFVLRHKLADLLPEDAHPGAIDGIMTGDKRVKRFGLKTNETLGRIGLDLGIGPYIHLADDRFSWWGSSNLDVLANAMEAIICAINQDQGIGAAARFIENKILCCLDLDDRSVELPMLPKDELEDLVNEHGDPDPEYEVLNHGQREDDGLFSVLVWLDPSEPPVCGRGITVEEAEQEAARRALLEYFESFSTD